ncbi:hypothetical protein EKK58_10860 [Candidatus Dependentiae bacterium]|nr:MAG: hypothetical protein EKK58_10860 [Candidatus Dependentiae bacterium]
MIKKIVWLDVLLLLSVACSMAMDLDQDNPKVPSNINTSNQSYTTNEQIQKITNNNFLLSNVGKIYYINEETKNIQKVAITYRIPRVFFGLFKEPVWKHITENITLTNNTENVEYVPIATEKEVFLAKIIKNKDNNITLEIHTKLGSHNTSIHALESYNDATQNDSILFSSSPYPSSKIWIFDKKKNVDERTYSSHPGYMMIGYDNRENRATTNTGFAAIRDPYLTYDFKRWQQRNNQTLNGTFQLFSYKNQPIDHLQKYLNSEIKIDFRQEKTWYTSSEEVLYVLIKKANKMELYLKLPNEDEDFAFQEIKSLGLTFPDIVGIHCINNDNLSNHDNLLIVTNKSIARIDKSIFKDSKSNLKNNALIDYWQVDEGSEITASQYNKENNTICLGIKKDKTSTITFFPVNNFLFPIQLNISNPQYTLTSLTLNEKDNGNMSLDVTVAEQGTNRTNNNETHVDCIFTIADYISKNTQNIISSLTTDQKDFIDTNVNNWKYYSDNKKNTENANTKKIKDVNSITFYYKNKSTTFKEKNNAIPLLILTPATKKGKIYLPVTERLLKN